MLAIEATETRRGLLLANVLKWLLPEIDVSLGRVRALIEVQQEADGDTLETSGIQEELRLVRGALDLAGCHGGLLLTEELCAAVRAVADGKLAEPLAALAIVSGATLQLSDYLDALLRDVPDRAAVLQPVLSELRLATGRPAVTESDLFVQQMQLSTVRTLLADGPSRTPGAAQVVAGKLLPAFQALILQWLKGVETGNTLLKLRKVGDHVASNASSPEVALLWSAFAAATDSLLAVPGAESLELKRWFGRMGQQLKLLAEEGEVAVVPGAPEIAWRLLAHAASIDSGSSRWTTLRTALQLDSRLPIESALQEARAQLRGPNTRLLEKVAAEVRADLTTVKDGLDLALRAGALSPEAQNSMRERLQRIASTLSLLGLPQLEQVLLNQAGELASLGSSEEAETQGQWMRIATALLRVESSLESALFRPLRLQGGEEHLAATRKLILDTPHSQDLRESIAALLREMLVDLAKLKAQLDAYLKGGELRDVNEPVEMLHEVTSGLIMLERTAGAELAGLLRDWLAQAKPAALREDPAVAVRFADAVASLELYVEALHAQLPHPERVLDVLSGVLEFFEASSALAALDEAPEAIELQTGAVLGDSLTQEPATVSAEPEAAEPVIALSLPEVRLDWVAPSEPAAAVPVAATEPATPEAPVAFAPPPAPTAPAAGDDPEIREIFIEEAQEVLEHLRQLLPVFHRQPQDAATLSELRRGFHTLKGSGRMVGATRISEFGWALEHLLNRCIEGALPINRAVSAAIDNGLALLPPLLEDFRDGREGSEEDAAQTLAARAHYLASGRAPEMVESDVLDVFRADAIDRLAEVERWLGGSGDFAIEPELVRALHTLKGSAGVVNAEGLSQLTAAIESVLRQLAHADVPAPPEVRAVIGEVLPVLREWTLTAGQSASPPAADWLARVEALKPFLPPAAETSGGHQREATANAAFDCLQETEASLVAWMAQATEPALARAMGNDARRLAEAGAACAPLARVAQAMADRLSAADLDLAATVPPDAGFFQSLANALEHCYQFLDSYREGGARDNGRALAEQLAQLPLHTVPIGYVEPEPEFLPEPGDRLAEPEPLAPLAHLGSGLAPEAESLQLHALPFSVPEPPEVGDRELAEVFVEEGRELMQTLETGLTGWQPPAAPPPELERALHTLAGSARMSGYHGLGDLAHGFEKRLRQLVPGSDAGAVIRAELDVARQAFAEGIEAYALMAGLPDRAPVGGSARPSSTPVFAPLPTLGERFTSAFVDAFAPMSQTPTALAEDGLPDEHAPPLVESDLLMDSIAPLPEPERSELVPSQDLSVGMPPEPVLVDRSPEPVDFAPREPAPIEPLEPILEPEAVHTPPPTELQWDEPAAAAAEPVADFAPAFEPQPVEPVFPAPDHWPEAAPLPEGATIDPELASIFIAEAAENLEAIHTALGNWRRSGSDATAVGEIQRALHTLKGGARMTGFMPMGEVSHEMESKVSALALRRELPTEADFETLGVDLETLDHMHDALARGHYDGLDRLLDIAPSAAAVLAEESPEVETSELASPEPAPATTPQQIPEGWDAELFWRPDEDGVVATRRELARVPVERLDTMLNEAGEISIYRSRLEQQNAALLAQLSELRQTTARLREQLRLLDAETDAQIRARGLDAKGVPDSSDRYGQDFDPLEMDRYSRMQELSRALAESVGDLGSLHLSMDQGVTEAQALLVQQARINTGVQQGLMSTLMVPFSRQVARLQRVVRQTAQEEGKLADAAFEGVESELDRNVLERMTAPLEHLLRNAVVHGLENAERRSAVGKPAQGTVKVSLKREGTQLVMEVADDGQGLNFDAIRAKAQQRGLMPEGVQFGDDEVARFIFEPGFSTAEKLTQSAGRGVGMDVVASEVKQLGGTLELRSEPGQGTRFTIRLPLSLSLSQALMVQVGDETYALPLVAIEGIGRVPRGQAAAAAGGGDAIFNYGGHDYRVRYLAELIDLPHALPEDARTLPAVLVRLGEGVAGGERRAALVVDALLGNREVVSKAVGPQLSSISGVSGATILPNGGVVLILDPAALVIDRARRRLIAEAAAVRLHAEPQPGTSGRLIMVVDDSVTMRRVAERLLQRNGYRVLTAKDGLDAIALLQNETPAAILLDIEMPRADGFEVAGFVRHHERLAETPIIMITSRSGDKHRARAATLGVDRYLIKPYQEDQLLHELRSLLQAREAAFA